MLFQKEPFFSVIVLSDTQLYASDYPEMFASQIEWIRRSKEDLNIRFVSHLGDIVNDNSSSKAQWQLISAQLSGLETEVPYGVIPGNHDADFYDDDNISFKMFNIFFPTEKFQKYDWYGGAYVGNQNSFQLIEYMNCKLLLVHLQIDPTDDVLHWAERILKKYHDRMAVVATHAYLFDDLPYRSDISHYGGTGNAGEDIWHKLIKKNCNVRLVISGHFHTQTGENYLKSTNTCGKPVHQIVQNFQDLGKGGNGFLRIYRFIPTKREIHISTYSPYSHTYKRGRKSNFMIHY